ncbi:formylglycine-generating enzyme family protein [Thiofilum flexile]|uniref:formylglycine-generating enzyme family protein n=1 Tax=Thiofilum flexile TaxID=125627 RepID=UPI000592B08A|nr:formylglycine-generating enzyme family protein [Thiofilum flexile]
MKNQTTKHKQSVPPGMTWISGGTFLMGADNFYPEEAPAHEVSVTGFWIDTHAVTNADFKRFVQATGYQTLAERGLDPALLPHAHPDLLAAGSLVFQMTRGPVDLSDIRQWWRFVVGACWKHPEGAGSTIQGRMKHPVVHIAYADALAYAHWAGKSLATEAQWEFAARGGLVGAAYAWGDELVPDGKHMANTWQGEFPWQNLALDGYAGTAPVGSYPPNGYGLYDMIGNVWEWTQDDYHSYEQPHKKPCCTPAIGVSPQRGKVLKGGSFLCAPSYCQRYRPAARSEQSPESATNHIGFRCVINVPS